MEWLSSFATYWVAAWEWSESYRHIPLMISVFLGLWIAASFVGTLNRLMGVPGWERLALYLLDPLMKWIVFGFGVALYIFAVAWPQNHDLGQVIARLGLSLDVDPKLLWVSTAVLLAVWIVIAMGFYMLARGAGAKLDRRVSILQPRTAAETSAFVLVLSPTAGILEEILFRGFLFLMFLQFNPDPWNAALWTSVLFAMGHAYQGIGGVLATGIMGYTAAASVIYTGTLWPAIIAHTVYDMLTVLMFKRLPEWPDNWENWDPAKAEKPFGPYTN